MFTDKKTNQNTDICFELESKNFITRDELPDDFAKRHINMPLTEKKALVARQVKLEDCNQFYDRTRGKKVNRTQSQS